MAKRYDVKGKSYFKYPNKYYYTDIGLRNARQNYRQYDPSHIMENMIYNELLRRWYSVDVGVVCDRTGDSKVQKEIDFVVNDADKKIYIQSAFCIDTDKKASSELSSLMLTKDFFKKIIVRMGCAAQFLWRSRHLPLQPDRHAVRTGRIVLTKWHRYPHHSGSDLSEPPLCNNTDRYAIIEKLGHFVTKFSMKDLLWGC